MVTGGTVALSDVRMVVDGLDHPECVTVDPECTVWAGGEAGQVYRVDPEEGSAQIVASTDGFLLGVTSDGGHHIYVCDIKHRAVLRVNVETGAVETVCTEVQGRPLVNPNYAVFDPEGRLYVTDSGHWQADDGYLFAIEPNGTARIVDEQARHFPNGIFLDVEANELYIAESTLPAVTKLHLSDGRLETVAELPGTVPDGLALDRERTVYVGCYRPDTILRISHGNVEVLASDPQGTVIAAPTNLAFGGRDGRTLYIASLGRWHLGAIRLPTSGLPLAYPARSSPGD